ncbi:MAG: tRNA (adenosine(37)-N6)-threonylcarbamoyltransferase complex ATPase subunit type 1 TsaE [Wenzhouxiangellaceae bacterium]|nr:tRNA (adenosine(37)-N6)-threonylcarbamoyltransferase complex ATPase subunit type 1 TsaE [Wenzhouxiangellaceae bacterium]
MRQAPAPRVAHARNEDEMLALGARLGRELAGGQVVELAGDLGAGKTTLVRGMLRGLGFAGRVKSPSYGLVEPYEIDDLDVFHLDLYRLSDPEELAFLGLDDLAGPGSVLLVEWPERGRGMLPAATRRIRIDDAETGRRVRIEDA